jgi:hypothetical protein
MLVVDAWRSSGDRAGLWIERLSVYRTGFLIDVELRQNPYVGLVPNGTASDGRGRFPRVGVRFSDGREAGRGEHWQRHTIPTGPDGYPTEIFIGYGGSHGALYSRTTRIWVHPLPPDGPMELFVASDADGVVESSITIEGALVRAASERSRSIWSNPSPDET